MHENLKYSIRLDEGIKPYNAISKFPNQHSIERKKEISDWQSLYAGNDYGTHYVIYGKFIGKKLKTGGFEVEKMQIYLQNYSGSVNIGLSEISFFESLDKVCYDKEDPENDKRYPNRKRFQLTVGLQGFVNNNCVNENVDLWNEYEPLIINNFDILYVDPFFLPIENSLSKIYEPEPDGNRKFAKFIDEKFLKRQGEDVFIHENGKNELKRLNELGFISNEEFDLIQVDAQLPYEIKGKQYPCTPWNSIFYAT